MTTDNRKDNMNNTESGSLGRTATLFFTAVLLLLSFGSARSQDTSAVSNTKTTADTVAKGLQIDTIIQKSAPVQTAAPDTVKRIDSLLAEETQENTLTNTKLFVYILLSILGLALFFFIFVMTLFKTFHKKKSTRQSLLLSWNLFFIVSIIWLFIVWGLVAGFWTVSSFMIVMIFLFIISLSMTIIALKSR